MKFIYLTIHRTSNELSISINSLSIIDSDVTFFSSIDTIFGRAKNYLYPHGRAVNPSIRKHKFETTEYQAGILQNENVWGLEFAMDQCGKTGGKPNQVQKFRFC